jgi:glycosyltransferase involved in cell wall biosynthesis
VSIIIPAYDAAATIARPLQSLLDQTFPDWEAIVVDDGSRDETAAIVARFAGRDPRFRLVCRPHEGVSAARNAGIRLARHDWLLFLDADDWLLPQMLERMTHALESKPGLDSVHCGWAWIAPDGTRIAEEVYDQAAEPYFSRAARKCSFAIHSVLVRRGLGVADVRQGPGDDDAIQAGQDARNLLGMPFDEVNHGRLGVGG